MKRLVRLLKCLLYGHFWEFMQSPKDWVVTFTCHQCGKTKIVRERNY